MPDDFDLDAILDKIKNRWDTDLTRSIWDDTWMPPKEERDEEPPQRDVPQRANRSRKKHKGNRRRK